MENKSLEYYALQFSSVSKDRLKDGNWLNNYLDQLNALNCSIAFTQDNYKQVSFILSQCFSVVPPQDTFLVAKCCQLMLTLVGKQTVKLEKPLLVLAVPWCLQALLQAADIAYLDILQALEAVICSSPEDIQQMMGELLAVLDGELESRTSMTTPQDVRVWRAQCVAALAPSVTTANRPQYIESLWRLLCHKPLPDCHADAQVIKCVLEALETLSQSDEAWLVENVGDVLGVIMAFLQFGLQSWQYQTPSRLYPLPGAQWDPPPAPNIKSKTKRRQKKRVSNIGNRKDVDDEVDEQPLTAAEPRSYMAPPAVLSWVTSDSEASDSEGGLTRRLKRTQARVRLAALNLLVTVAKAVNVRDLFGYYSSLLGNQGLQHSLLSDPNPRLSSLAASTIAFLLGNAKSYFAQAQQSSVTSYTPFSSVLASLLESLHQCVIRSLSSSASMSVLHCASCLVDVTPYCRLRPGLLPPLLQATLPFIKHKEVVVSVASLTVLGCAVAVQPCTNELRELLVTSQPPITLPAVTEVASCSWVLSASLQYLEGEHHRTGQVPERVEWWQVLTNLVRYHFLLVRAHVSLVMVAILKDIGASSEPVRLHAARTFQHLATALGSAEDDQAECTSIWTEALQSQLLGLVGASPILAAVVCDCLAVMCANTYQHLSEKLQICCITCLLGCGRDDEPAVRAAAVQALAAYLTFPTLSQDEEFLYDCSDVICCLVKDPLPLVSGKAAWALGNLTDMLYKNQHGEEIIPPIKLISTSLEAAQGKVKVRANGVRALGNLLGLLKDRHLTKPEYKDVALNAAQNLVKNALSTNSMKVSWNACYALGSMLKNEALHTVPSPWQDMVVPALSALVVRSSNFKVRTNACAALGSVGSRKHYSSHYLAVWRAILEGLQNAMNMTDFKEVKHQDGLLEQLCLTLCHLASLVELNDLTPLHEVIVYHLDTMQHHLSRFLATTVPERTEAVLMAAARVAQLRESTELSTSQSDATVILASVFTFDI